MCQGPKWRLSTTAKSSLTLFKLLPLFLDFRWSIEQVEESGTSSFQLQLQLADHSAWIILQWVGKDCLQEGMQPLETVHGGTVRGHEKRQSARSRKLSQPPFATSERPCHVIQAMFFNT